ncbi:probable 39S ribosomal protein L49, mitochondrial [Colletes gigas]|uniref:probable 39S ribosomal protein L49, mitochondrial n=1 Tax=Colletes gigas TaxID=935657 RepID=UPI001C9B3B96|nr:probable 39S ribosomal protein L49, mitochondrial [Colletes gigas]
MAALRLFARSRLSTIILRSSSQLELRNNVSPIVYQIHKRWGSFKSSPKYIDSAQYANYEVTQDPEEWEYVERILKPKLVPEPPLQDTNLPSGWKPPTSKPGDHPYYIHRTKSYMQPVYLYIGYRGLRRLTTIRKIDGDIWLLRTELKKYLEENTGKHIGIRVNELSGQIQFRGDYVTLVKKWCDSKGF